MLYSYIKRWGTTDAGMPHRVTCQIGHLPSRLEELNLASAAEVGEDEGRWRMTYEQVVAEVMRLPAQERLRLLEVIAASLQVEHPTPVPRGVPASQVEGILKPDGPMPTDEELKDDYTRYLIEKYT